MSFFDYNPNVDMLQLNMENISKELNELIVTGEEEFVKIQHFSMATATVPPSAITTATLQSNFQVPAYSKTACQLPHHPYAVNGMQHIQHNPNYYATRQQPLACVSNAFNNFAATRACDASTNYNTIGSSQPVYTNPSSSPTYEFHYLPSNGENEKKFSTSCSLVGNGAYRKAPRFIHKHFNQKLQNTPTENEQIKVDLSVLDFTNSCNKTSTVRYIFDHLRDLHSAVAETLLSYETNEDSQYVETFAPSATNKSKMPTTLNVQNQVKQACRKLTIFICDMQRLLDGNKAFDFKMHAECEYYLNNLRQYLNQLEVYKLIEMEHKRGQFLKEKVIAQAERLSLLLEHINRQIREVHIRIVAVDWYIGVIYRGDIQAAAMPPINVKDNKENSKTGVINEILKLCNTTTISPSSLNTQTAATKPEMTTINSPMKLINNNNNKEVVQEQSLLNKITTTNNNIFTAYKPDHIRRSASGVNTTVNTNSYNRHPVFYIG